MKELISSIISDMSEVGKPHSKFLKTLFPTILATRGRVTFRTLSRYSDLHEKTYSRQFAKAFDFVSFNRALTDQTLGTNSERIGAFDASFIPKADRSTYMAVASSTTAVIIDRRKDWRSSPGMLS